MVSDEMMMAAVSAYVKVDKKCRPAAMRAALEAALSADAEPVMYVSEQQLAKCVGHYVPSRKEAEGNFQLALYRVPPAPSVAVKADREAIARIIDPHNFMMTGADYGTDEEGFKGTWAYMAQRVALTKADCVITALSAQVQDVAKPKGYAAIHAHTVRQAAARAENDKDTLHLAGGLYDAMRWIEDVADKQFVPEEITREMDYAGHDKFVDVSSTRYTGSDPHREIFNAMLAAAPAAKLEEKP